MIEALTKVEEVTLFYTLPTHLFTNLLTEVSQGATLNRLIDFGFNSNLGEVPAALVASAFSKLEEVQLYFTRLTSDQVAALMEQIDQGDSRLKRLSLLGLLQTEGERTQPLNLKPLVKLEEVELSPTSSSLNRS